MDNLYIRGTVIYKDSWSLFKRNFWNLLCCVIIISSQIKRTLAIELSVWEVRSGKLSIDKSRIPKLGDSSRKFIPEIQRRAMTDAFVERITRTRTDKGETVSGRKVETRSQKSSEEQKAMLEVEVHPDQAMNENREIYGPEGRGNRRLAEPSDISTEIVATRKSPTDNNMMAGVTEKQATSSSFSERVKYTFGNIFPFTMGVGTGDEGESQEEEEDDEEQADFGSQVSLNSSTQENEAYTDRGTGTMDQFGVVRTISKTTNTSG